jgi:streptomycin 6-kinase
MSKSDVGACEVLARLGVMAWILQRGVRDASSRKAAAERRWQLKCGPPLEGGYRSHVLECTTHGGVEAVLKLTVTMEEAEAEAAALMAWRSTGAAVQLLDVDVENAALLLERIRPATPLPAGNDRAAIAVASDLLAKLHSATTDFGFPTLAELFPYLAEHSRSDAEYERHTRNEPDRAAVAVERLPLAEAAALKLCATANSNVLQHGDFLDKNLLWDGVRYVSVDPIPRFGEPAADIGFFACHHPPAAGMLTRAEAISRRIDRDVADRAMRWAAVWAVLLAASAWREDQRDLDALITSRDFEQLLHV